MRMIILFGGLPSLWPKAECPPLLIRDPPSQGCELTGRSISKVSAGANNRDCVSSLKSRAQSRRGTIWRRPCTSCRPAPIGTSFGACGRDLLEPRGENWRQIKEKSKGKHTNDDLPWRPP